MRECWRFSRNVWPNQNTREGLQWWNRILSTQSTLIPACWSHRKRSRRDWRINYISCRRKNKAKRRVVWVQIIAVQWHFRIQITDIYWLFNPMKHRMHLQLSSNNSPMRFFKMIIKIVIPVKTKDSNRIRKIIRIIMIIRRKKKHNNRLLRNKLISQRRMQHQQFHKRHRQQLILHHPRLLPL